MSSYYRVFHSCFNPLHGSSPWRTPDSGYSKSPDIVSIRSTALHRGEPAAAVGEYWVGVFQSAPRLFTVENRPRWWALVSSRSFNPLHGSSPWRTTDFPHYHPYGLVSIRSTALHRGERQQPPTQTPKGSFNPLHGSSPWRTHAAFSRP